MTEDIIEKTGKRLAEKLYIAKVFNELSKGREENPILKEISEIENVLISTNTDFEYYYNNSNEITSVRIEHRIFDV